MKTSACGFFRILFFSFLAHLSFAQTIQNPIGPATGRISAVADYQFLGARFPLSSRVMLVSVGAEFQNSYGSCFAALVPLSSMTALPVGNPGAGVPFNPGEVLAYRTFSLNVGGTPQIVTVPFSGELSPGVYGVVFGTGLFGTYAAGGMPDHDTVAGSSSFFWSDQPWRWQDSSSPNYESNIRITLAPQLTINPLGTDVVLSWPANATGFTLQSAAGLDSGAVWTNVLPSAVEVNGLFAVTNAISGAQQFYRLSQ